MVDNDSVTTYKDEGFKWVGMSILFFPLLVSLFPYSKILKDKLQDFYNHVTPRNEWAEDIEAFPPRYYIGFGISMLFTSVPVWLVIYSIDENFSDTFKDWAIITAYLLFPLITSLLRPEALRSFDVWDICIILLVLVPLEISKYTDFIPLKEFDIAYEWPALDLSYVAACVLCLFIFTIIRPLKEPHNNSDKHAMLFYLDMWKMKSRDFLRLLIAVILYSIVAVPICLGMEFFHYSSSNVSLWSKGIGDFLAIFLVQGMIWELLYRAFFQGMLHSNIISQEFEMQMENSEDFPNYSHLNDDGLLDTNDSLDERSVPLRKHDKRSNRRRDNRGPGNTWAKFLLISPAKQWTAVIFASVFYATASIDYTDTTTSDEVAYWFLLFWLGICSGWLFYHTKHVVWSALFYSIVFYLGTVVLGVDCNHNSGLCKNSTAPN